MSDDEIRRAPPPAPRKNPEPVAKKPAPAEKTQRPAAAREDRLAEALRANLRRRKQP